MNGADTGIPEDVMALAEDAYLDAVVMTSHDEPKAMVIMLARAILAERKRWEARVAPLTEALKPFAEAADSYDPDEGDTHSAAWLHAFPIGALRRARYALSNHNTVSERRNERMVTRIDTPFRLSPTLGPLTKAEELCFKAAIRQWEASLSRPDMMEHDRVRGAIEAYIRQATALKLTGDWRP